MNLWSVLLVGLFGAGLVAFYFATRKQMVEGRTPPGPVDAQELYGDREGTSEGETFEGESEMDVRSHEAAEDARNLGG